MNEKIICIGIVSMFLLTSISALSVIGMKVTDTGAPKTTQVADDGDTLYVGGSGPGNYTNIQDAINDANNGDTVYVYGRGKTNPYHSIVINKSINLVGENKLTTYIVDGYGPGYDAIRVFADNVVITGFTINATDETTDSVVIKNSHNCEIYNCAVGGSCGSCILITNDGGNDRSGKHKIHHCDLLGTGGLGAPNGVYLYYSDDNEIYNCDVSSCASGFFVIGSNNNRIYHCNIFENYYEGVYISSGTRNIVYQNNFRQMIGFIFDPVNAKDCGSENQWHYGGKGNYWNDYFGLDVNPRDGIGDIPYDKIAGGDSQDPYPLTKPYGKSKIKSAHPALFNTIIVKFLFLKNHPLIFQLLQRLLKL